jgi:glycosyltransferase involved in cell wall biosynthesis
MRVLHVVPTYLPATRYGGPIYSVHGLCKALAALGHDVHVLTTSVDGDGDSAVPLDRSVDVEGVQVRYFASHMLRRLYYAPAMQRWLADEIAGFDVVHLHSVFLWPTSMAARLAARAGVPYVVSPRGMLVRELIERKSRWLKTAWLSLIESETLARAAAIHLTSERELSDARALALPIPTPFVMPNGVELPASASGLAPSARIAAIAARGPYALYLGRIHWIKGLDHALEALVGSAVRLVIAGNDEEQQRPVLERLAMELGVSDRVAFELPVFGPDKWALLAGARFVILPSVNENFGNVVLEGMAVGRPVIVTRSVGASELVASAGAGLVVGPTADELRAAMDRLWNDPLLAERLGRAARQRAQRTSWSAIAGQLAERYAQLIERERAAVA